MLYLHEWIPEYFYEVDFSGLTPDRWDELEEMILNDIKCQQEAESHRYPSFILQSESDEKIKNRETEHKYNLKHAEAKLKEAENTILRLQYRNYELHRQLQANQ